MTALLQASVGARIKERVKELEEASSHNLEEDCGERIEHSRLDEREYGQTIGQTAWRYDTERHDNDGDMKYRILPKNFTFLTERNGRVCVTVNFCQKLMA